MYMVLWERFGFMVAHAVATVEPTKLEDYKIHQDPLGISGSQLFFLFFPLYRLLHLQAFYSCQLIV